MLEKKKILFGCIADDFTGGSDAASFLSLGGLKTILCNGIPKDSFELPDECEAVVIALKSRTQETGAAVNDSLSGIRWLKKQGAKQVYFKYCSTFDSTEEGNIGPVTDAILEELNVPGTILCPALPANDRIVEDGILYVKGVPLAESPMRNHPLTPMTKSRISELMDPQGKYKSLEIHGTQLQNAKSDILNMVEQFAEGKEHYYLIPDYRDDRDAEKIVSCFGDEPFLTGGSGILTALARHITGRENVTGHFAGTDGKAILVAGSCSTATHMQTEWYKEQGAELVRLSDEKLLSGEQTAESIWEIIRESKSEAPLIYSYDTPEGLAKKRNAEGKRLAALVERTLSKVAEIASKNGYYRIIAAGGETSGAVTQKLGYDSFWIGEIIAPGVPILIPLKNQKIRLVLKSGNFGQEDFFGRALKMTGEE